MTIWQTNIYALSPWIRVVVEKVLVAEVVKKFIAIYVARQFIAVRPMAVNSPSHYVECTSPWEVSNNAAKETISPHLWESASFLLLSQIPAIFLAILIYSIHSHSTSLRSVVIFPYLGLGLPSALFLSSFPQELLYISFSSASRVPLSPHRSFPLMRKNIFVKK